MRQRDSILSLFRSAARSWSIDEVAAITGVTASEIAAIAEDPADVLAVASSIRWTPRMISEALSSDSRLRRQVPVLNRIAARRVRLPEYQWRLMGWLADEERKRRAETIVSDVLERAVFDSLVAEVDDDAEAAIPGIRAAMDWPLTVGDGRL